eukprot:TRINITY_DN917_c0_g1_i2.p1 TRINITY_DN917_c0_g1~~TRINITY_DN917_c0_g1_i2.p1  ORF type:complete len:300 (+),score=68.61 TRINITY_DN917_c0_g1_i2:80-979(+)
MSNKEYVYLHNVVNNQYVPPFFTQEMYDTICEKVPFQDNDVIISTYPKSGTTWTQNILYHLLHDDPIPSELNITDIIPWHETNKDACKHVLTDPFRCFKSHLDWPMTFKPENVNVKYIYVCRNGKDVAVSMFHHARGFKEFGYDGDWDDWFERYMAGHVEFGKWADHCVSWWEVKDQDNVLFLFYEDMKNDIRSEIQKIIDFLEITVTNEKIEDVVQKTTFKSMKSNPKTNYSQLDPFRNLDKPKFFRKGEIGDWKNYFSDEQNERFDQMYQELILDKTNNELQFQFSQSESSNNNENN